MEFKQGQMNDKLAWIVKNLHLILSLSIVIPTAIIYGSPSKLPAYLDIQVNSIDLANMLKALMCLYLGISLVWILGLVQKSFWRLASSLNVLFMLSLAFGRLISMISNGLPSGGFIFAFIAELAIGCYAIYQLLKSKNTI